MFGENNAKLRDLLFAAIPALPVERDCDRARPRSPSAGRGGVMAEKVLVTIEMRFTTNEDPEQLGDRIREAVATIVGRQALEDFRVRSLPLDAPKEPRGRASGRV